MCSSMGKLKSWTWTGRGHGCELGCGHGLGPCGHDPMPIVTVYMQTGSIGACMHC